MADADECLWVASVEREAWRLSTRKTDSDANPRNL
jgi:hypothetical protein